MIYKILIITHSSTDFINNFLKIPFDVSSDLQNLQINGYVGILTTEKSVQTTLFTKQYNPSQLYLLGADFLIKLESYWFIITN